MTGLLSTAALALDRQRGRSLQTTMGASDIGPCLRRAAYLRHEVSPTDPDEGSMSAVIGTWMHAGAQEALWAAYGTIPETFVVHPDGLLTGHIDGIDLAEDLRRRIRRVENRPPVGHDVTTVEDLKTRADDRLIDAIRRDGPPSKEKRQVYTYAWLLQEFGAEVDPQRKKRVGMQRALRALGPISPARVRIRYVARDRGDEYVHEEKVDPGMIREAAERYEYVAASEKPEDVDREQDGPGLSWVCDSCPFVTACWGATAVDDAGVWPQHIRIREGATTVEAELERYQRGMALEREAKALKEPARAALSGEPAGQYGTAGILAWRGGKPRGPVEDVDAMRALLTKAGVPIPTKDGGRGSKTISVRPTDPEPTAE